MTVSVVIIQKRPLRLTKIEANFFNSLRKIECLISDLLLQGFPSQLISYDRPDETGPKVSEFYTTEISDPDKLKAKRDCLRVSV